MAKETSKMAESAEVKRVSVGSRLEKTYIVCSECGAEVDVVENDNPDNSLVEKILAKKVPDREDHTYQCPNGHNEGLEVR